MILFCITMTAPIGTSSASKACCASFKACFIKCSSSIIFRGIVFFKRMKVTWETNVADMNDFNPTLGKMRQYFESGSTLSYPFRKKQLNRLLETILTYEEEINAALYADL